MIRRTTSFLAAIALAFAAMPPAYGAPEPRREEWWFGTWDIQNKVWPISTGRGVTVAVIDSGVNAALSDLRGAVLSGADMDAHKGDGRTDFDTENRGHGTAMATLIAGRGDGTGMIGIAPEAKILPVVGLAGSEAVQNGIRFSVDHGAKVVNISLANPSPESLTGCGQSTKAAISYALEHDVVVVASAGNDGDGSNDPSWPAQCPGVLAVGAVDYMFVPWVKTQRQPYVAVSAPGVHVGSIDKSGNFIPNLNGTSQAAALTTAVIALVRSKFPKMSAREVVQRVIASAIDVGRKGPDEESGYGLIRPYHALVDSVPADAPNPVFAAWVAAKTSPSAVTPAASSVAKRGRSTFGASKYLLLASAISLIWITAVVGMTIRSRYRN